MVRPCPVIVPLAGEKVLGFEELLYAYGTER
jgi:hypothetical protein